MLRKHRGFIIFTAIVTIGGIGARLAWDATTDQQEPPIWATLLVAAVLAPLAVFVESRIGRPKGSRSHRKPAQ